MPRVSGTYSLPPSYRAISGQTIRTEQHNPPLEDIAVALTQSVPRDGSAPMTGNLPMNGLRITNLGAATQASDAVRRDQVTLYSAYLSSVAGLALEANQLVYATGAGIAGKTAFTALGRTLVGNSTPALMRATLEVPDVIDEDSFATNSATRPPSQQSVKAYVDAQGIGVGQNWVSKAISSGTSYRNTTGRPIMFSATRFVGGTIEVSSNGSSWVTLLNVPNFNDYEQSVQIIVPNGHYYRVTGNIALSTFAELR